MKKIKYIFIRICSLNYEQMIRTAKLVNKRTGKSSIAVFFDMIYCGFKYMAGYMDYLVFEFYNLTADERKTYITRGENNKIVSRLNNKEYWNIFEDKTIFNETFSDFLGRRWLDLRKTSPEDFEKFVRSFDKIVVKPINGTCGRGIEFIVTSEIQNCRVLYNRLLENKQCMIDEYVPQNKELARLYPISLNTVRLVTILNNGLPTVVFAALRVGNGKMVDNLNSGGMAAVINLDSGIITKPAADKDGFAYGVHPYTKVEFANFKIPRFDEAIDLVKRAAVVVPQVGYVGWDVAITDSGVLLIEANHFPGNDIYQFQVHLDNKIGLLPRFKEAMGEKID
ncbi:MAG: sugar-transfer associated ATP-grasp domain-containing protein [Oscillospiraceae bacterium]